MKNNLSWTNAQLLLIGIFTFTQLGTPEIARGQQASLIEPNPPPPVEFYVPMTAQERWKAYAGENFTQPGAFFQTFFTALGDQTGKVPSERGGGAGEFPRRFASEFARFTIGGTIKSAIAAGLHEDTRFHSCTCRGALARTAHAVSRTFLTYDRNGRRTPDIAGLAGLYVGPIVMTTWYPSRFTELGYGVRQGNLAVGITAGVNVIREFSPELKGLFRHRGSRESASPMQQID
jgi:hypothetical protein